MISGVGASASTSTSVFGRDSRTGFGTSDADARPKSGLSAKPKTAPAAPGGSRSATGKPLTTEQQRQIQELQARDREVRAHESAHKSVGGSLAGAMSFTYQTGPDGRRYAVGGEVSIDSGAEGDPEKTIAKMQRVIAAALAPAEPSSQDRSVASAAQATLAEAQRQLADLKRSERSVDEEGRGRAARGYGPPPEPAGGLLDLIT